MDTFDLYKDIKARTGGEIYIGVVGPVRTGKSTFIKRFMDTLVIPAMEEDASKARAIDELPQSAQGKTIMTTEPKFIPKEAAQVTLYDDTTVKIRLIDCVGYMTEGATGHLENEKERMVKTPWYDYEIPFTQAAEIGTRKVIRDHSTIGIIITTDGSFGEIPRENYGKPEEKTIDELKKLGKPFVVLLNSAKPFAAETKELATSMEEQYAVPVLPVNCEQLRKDDITRIMESVLSSFPVSLIRFNFPKWVEMLSPTHEIKLAMVKQAKEILHKIQCMKEVKAGVEKIDTPYIKQIRLEQMDMQTGVVSYYTDIDKKFYYQIISELMEIPVQNEYQFITVLKNLSEKRSEYEKVSVACDEVNVKGYGVVTPKAEDISLTEPEIIRHGSKFGVKLKASAPTIHMIQANIITEIAPIVGSEEQAKDLITYMTEQEGTEGIWETNIFGKTIKQLVEDGIATKIGNLTEECQVKLQESMQKIINESEGGLVCFII